MALEKPMQRRYGIKVVLHLKIHVYLFSKFLLLSIIIPGVKSLRTKTISNKAHFVQGRPFRTKA